MGENALCPSCYTVCRQERQQQSVSQTARATTLTARYRVLHFLDWKHWCVGADTHSLSFNDFWTEFYRWSELKREYTKKSEIRKAITEMCGIAHDACYLPIAPQQISL